MSDHTSKTRTQAETAFRKTQKAARDEARSEAMREYEDQAAATREKSARLKALRLAKEAADSKAAAEAKQPAAKKKRPAAKAPTK